MPTPANNTIIDVFQDITGLLNNTILPAQINTAVDTANIAIDTSCHRYLNSLTHIKIFIHHT
jgi:hypothetical protein